jgi:hypothetical protein
MLGAPTVVRNNLTSQLNVDTRDTGVVPDHNVVLCCGPGPEISWYVNGVIQFIGQPGTYMNSNIIETHGTKGEFVNFNPATLTYTILLKSTAQAIGAGVAGAPTTDIVGVTRTAPYLLELIRTRIERNCANRAAQRRLTFDSAHNPEALVDWVGSPGVLSFEFRPLFVRTAVHLSQRAQARDDGVSSCGPAAVLLLISRVC